MNHVYSFVLLSMALLLSACGPREGFHSRAVYAPLSPLFTQVEVEAAGELDPRDNLSDRNEVRLIFFSNSGRRAEVQLESRGGRLELAAGLPGTDFSRGRLIDPETLREVMIALDIVTAGQFKLPDAEELHGLIAAAARGPGAEPPSPVRFQLLESSVDFDQQ